MDISNPIKEINRLRKEINRLLNKGMPNIYLKVIIEKNWRSQKFDFRSLTNLSPGQFKNQRSGSKTVCGFFII